MTQHTAHITSRSRLGWAGGFMINGSPELVGTIRQICKSANHKATEPCWFYRGARIIWIESEGVTYRSLHDVNIIIRLLDPQGMTVGLDREPLATGGRPKTKPKSKGISILLPVKLVEKIDRHTSNRSEYITNLIAEDLKHEH